MDDHPQSLYICIPNIYNKQFIDISINIFRNSLIDLIKIFYDRLQQNNYQYIMSEEKVNKRRIKVYKLFHIELDNTTSVPQKVFFLENQVKLIQYHIKNNSRVFGLIGSAKSVSKKLSELQKIITGDQEQSGIDFSLQQKEKSAIFFLTLNSDQEKFIIFILIFPQVFFYTKPIKKDSTLILLTRYLGDFCNKVILVYDQIIEKDFEIKGNPFTTNQNNVVSLFMTEQNVKDIKIEKSQCDFSRLNEYDSKFSKKIQMEDLNSSNCIYINKVLLEDLKERQNKEIQKMINKVWQFVYIKKQQNIDRISVELVKSQKKQLRELIKYIVRSSSQFNRQISGRSESMIKQILKHYSSNIPLWNNLNQWFTSYKYTGLFKILYNRFLEKSKMYLGRIEINKYDYLYYDILEEVFKQIDSQYHYIKRQQYSTYSGFHINKYIKQVCDIIYSQLKFLQKKIREQFSKQFGSNEQIIDLVAFNIKILKTKQGLIQRASIDTYDKIEFSNKIKQKLNLENFSSIKNIHYFQLTNRRKSKLIWIELDIKLSKKDYTSIMIIYFESELKIVKKITITEDYTIHFNRQNQKAYMIIPSLKQIQHFKFDENQKIIQEKVNTFSSKIQKIISLGISILPEKLFYLTEQRNIVYYYDIKSNKQGEISKQIIGKDKTIKYLRYAKEQQYNYIKTFNQDSLLVLGHSHQVHVYETNGLVIRQIIKLNNTFLGISIFSDKLNEYMIIHDSNKSEMYIFKNMSSENILEQKMLNKKTSLGNPIIDIFYEAYQRFGEYLSQNQKRNLQLIHLTNLQNKAILTYSQELFQSDDHIHKFFKWNELINLFQYLKKSESPRSNQELLNLIYTRIPIQICTIQDGNIHPLYAGRKLNLNIQKQLSIAQRSRLLSFGVIQELICKQLDKKCVIVSIMGAQSTGKSYLMNRLFGSRFSVASSRCTDGVWLSFSSTKEINFILLDCQGLFSNDRTHKQEEKLIKILASVSDFTILNLNMSLTNRSITDLLESISSSITKSIQSDTNILYKGQLFVVVRDVQSKQSDKIVQQFKRNFYNTQNKKKNNFIKKLFSGSIQIMSLCNFELVSTFKRQMNKIRNHIKQSVINKQKSKKPKQFLNILKILLNQLEYDDTSKIDNNLIQFKFQQLLEELKTIEKQGSYLNKKIKLNVRGIQIQLSENDIILNFEKTEQNWNVFDRILKQTILREKLTTLEFNQVYTSFNKLIKSFFDLRKEEIRTVLYNKLDQMKDIDEQDKNNFSRKTLDEISADFGKMRLCLQNCYQCKLLCVGKYGHKSHLEEQKQANQNEIYLIQKKKQKLSLTQKQIRIKDDIIKYENQTLQKIKIAQQLKLLSDSVLDKQQNLKHIQNNIIKSNNKLTQAQKNIKQVQQGKLTAEFKNYLQNIKQYNILCQKAGQSNKKIIFKNEIQQILKNKNIKCIQQIVYQNIQILQHDKTNNFDLLIQNNKKQNKKLQSSNKQSQTKKKQYQKQKISSQKQIKKEKQSLTKYEIEHTKLQNEVTQNQNEKKEEKKKLQNLENEIKLMAQINKNFNQESRILQKNIQQLEIKKLKLKNENQKSIYSENLQKKVQQKIQQIYIINLNKKKFEQLQNEIFIKEKNFEKQQQFIITELKIPIESTFQEIQKKIMDKIQVQERKLKKKNDNKFIQNIKKSKQLHERFKSNKSLFEQIFKLKESLSQNDQKIEQRLRQQYLQYGFFIFNITQYYHRFKELSYSIAQQNQNQLNKNDSQSLLFQQFFIKYDKYHKYKNGIELKELEKSYQESKQLQKKRIQLDLLENQFDKCQDSQQMNQLQKNIDKIKQQVQLIQMKEVYCTFKKQKKLNKKIQTIIQQLITEFIKQNNSSLSLEEVIKLQNQNYNQSKELKNIQIMESQILKLENELDNIEEVLQYNKMQEILDKKNIQLKKLKLIVQFFNKLESIVKKYSEQNQRRLILKKYKLESNTIINLQELKQFKKQNIQLLKQQNQNKLRQIEKDLQNTNSTQEYQKYQKIQNQLEVQLTKLVCLEKYLQYETSYINSENIDIYQKFHVQKNKNMEQCQQLLQIMHQSILVQNQKINQSEIKNEYQKFKMKYYIQKYLLHQDQNEIMKPHKQIPKSLINFYEKYLKYQQQERRNQIISDIEQFNCFIKQNQQIFHKQFIEQINQKIQEGNLKNFHYVILDELCKDMKRFSLKQKENLLITQDKLNCQKQQCQKKLQKLKEKKQEYNKLISQFDKFKIILDKLKQKLKKNRQKIIKIKQQISVKKSKLEDLTNQQKKLILKIKQLDRSINQNTIAMNKNKDLIINLQNLIQSTNNINFKLMKQLISHAYLQQKENNKNKIICDEQKQILKNLNENKNSLQKQIQELKEKLGLNTRESIESLIQTLKNQTKDIAILKNKLQELELIKQKQKQLYEKKFKLENQFKQVCSCNTNHKCDQKCQAGCQLKYCVGIAGHKGNHLCAQQNHKCKQKCQLELLCNKKCAELYGHNNQIKHSCHLQHSCSYTCDFCKSKCSKKSYQQHKIHICQKKVCTYKCIFCQKQCVSPHHDHDSKTETVTIYETIRQEIDEKITYKENRKIINLHLCDSQHKCRKICEQKGVCSTKYRDSTRQWINKQSKFNYKYREQIQNRQECKIMIARGQYQHQGVCNCKVVHTCQVRCSDCKSLCQYQHNHQDIGKGQNQKKLHNTQHRNQQCLKFASEKQNTQIQVSTGNQKQNIKILFQVGQLAAPFTCEQSCKRKGRSHYHLRECISPENCGQKKYGSEYVRHSNKIYYPFKQKKYDMFLCTTFWESINFQNPNKDNEQIDKCNFMCPSSEHEKKPQFCKKHAWHSFSTNRVDHQYECDVRHKNIRYEDVEICFLIDSTASMNRYIQQCKQTVKKMMVQAKQKNPKLNVKFAVVGYRDHPNSDSKQQKDLTLLLDKKILELQALLNNNPFPNHSYTENQYIKILVKIQQTYNLVKGKKINRSMLFNDFELFIIKYKYPFIFDINSSQEFIDPRQKLMLIFSGANMLNSLLRMIAGQQNQGQPQVKQPLISIIYKQLIQKKKQKEESKQVPKLIQKLEFTQYQKAIEFLDKLESVGGEDFTQAVLDGMNQILSLNWSKNQFSLKYVFHIMDAPPHGKNFHTEQLSDKFPQGCPCKLNHQKILKKIEQKDLKYVIFPLTEHVNKTIEAFQESGFQFKVSQIKQPQELTFNAVEIICKQLQQNDHLVNA